MKRIVFFVLAAAGLVACSSQPRTGPPAPIESTSPRYVPPAEVAKPTPPPPPPEKTVELYAYRPPSSAPDAVAPGGAAAGGTPAETASAVPAEATAGGSAAPVPSEGATPKPAAPTSPPSAATKPEVPTAPKTAAPKPAPPVPAQRPPAAPAPQVVAYVPPPPPAPKLPPAADALTKQAEQQRRAGDYVGAAATLERALRIEPQEAYLWNRLARVRREQGLNAQAGNMAARSNALAKDQAPLKQDNWSIIAGARRAAGDAAGAAEAERKARGG